MLRRSTRNVKKSNEDSEGSNILNIHKKIESQIKNKKYSTGFRSSDSEQEILQSEKRISKNKKIPAKKPKCNISDSSSSESDIESYLQPVEKIDLNSSFFNDQITKEEVSSFDKIEKEIFSGVTVTKLSDSDTSEDELIDSPAKSVYSAEVSKDKALHDDDDLKNTLKEEESIAKLNFQQLQAYQKKIEDAKKSIELYNIKHAQEIIQVKVDTDNIDGLLAAGEAKQNDGLSQSITSTNCGTLSDSEQEDWEEIKDEHEKQLVPKKELEITVEMPTTLKKKKDNDLLSAVKRRLNRIRKENQILIHKVHLLCWIAHGNYVNSVLNDESIIALGLSLIPSERCYPAGRIDLDYLEQVLKWYKRTIKVNETLPSKSKSLSELLTEHIDKKETYSKKFLVLIFIIILRSLGIQCRLILSLQIEPLRPPSSDLHFLGKSSDSKPKRLNGETSKHSTTFHAEKDHHQKEVKMKKEHKSNPHLNKSSIETSCQDHVGLRTAIVNIERMQMNSSNAHQSIKRKVTSSEPSIKSQKLSKNDKTAKTSSNNLNQIIQTEKISKKCSEQKTEKVKSQSQGKKAKKLHNVEDGKLKVEAIAPKIFRSTRLKSKASSNDSEKKSRSKSTSIIGEDLEITNIKKTRSKSTSSKTGITNILKKVTIPQLDRSDDNLEEFKGFDEQAKPNKILGNISFENFYSQIYCQVSDDLTTQNPIKLPQLDGATDEPNTSSPNLKVLRKTNPNEKCKSKNHRKSTTKRNYKGGTSDSDDYFRESPHKKSKAIDKGKVDVRSASESPEKKCDNSDKEKSKVNLNKLHRIKAVSSENKVHSKDVTSDIMQLIKGRISEQKQIDKGRQVKKRKANKYKSNSDDSDYVPEVIKKKYDSDDEFYPKLKVKQRLKVKKEVKKVLKKPKDSNSRKVISSDSEYTDVEIETKDEKKFKGETTKKKIGNDVWLEVFLETEEKWICVDVIYGQIHCINELYSRATHPVSYVLSWDNTNHIKDITRRYCQNYNTVTRKCRIDSHWWEESLKPFIGPKNARDREEDDELNRQQLEKPLPTTISEYKNHPLYALERHLLKFEALYPPNAPPLGFVRNEPVYSRDCVHICHSRDIWLKEAKVVKLKEKPYKIVKARPKYDKLSNTLITDQNLEIFGPWQVEDYVPPTAKNGIVPRNAFGNVDLFKPSMLPKKCVHLQLPGLNKTARKMNIDCASAIVGFDFHGGWSHPVYDGFVVCEEFEDQLIAAWNIEQEEIEQKEQEKFEKRVYGNWKKLIRGLLIKERLKVKYGFGQEHQEPSPGSSNKNYLSNPKSSTKKRNVISDSSESE